MADNKENAIKKVRFCPICANLLDEVFNIDIRETEGLECRRDKIFIQINTCLAVDLIGFSFVVSGGEE